MTASAAILALAVLLALLFARRFHFEAVAFFTAEEAVSEDVKVDFGTR